MLGAQAFQATLPVAACTGVGPPRLLRGLAAGTVLPRPNDPRADNGPPRPKELRADMGAGARAGPRADKAPKAPEGDADVARSLADKGAYMPLLRGVDTVSGTCTGRPPGQPNARGPRALCGVSTVSSVAPAVTGLRRMLSTNLIGSRGTAESGTRPVGVPPENEPEPCPVVAGGRLGSCAGECLRGVESEGGL